MRSVNRMKVMILLLAALTFASCKKGEQGPPGKDGTANVTHKTFSVNPWSSNSSRWFSKLSVPEITADNLNASAIQVYVSVVPDTWMAIPATVVASTNYFWGFVSAAGVVEVRWEYNGFGIGDDPNDFYGTTVLVKVVVIPAEMKAKNPDVNVNNYQEVKEAYQLSS